MYGNTISSGAKWIFFGFVGVVMMAILLGTDLKKSTWLNREIAAADARDKNVETAYKEQQYQLTMAQEQMRLEAERERLVAERETQKALDAQKIANRQVAFETWMTVLSWVGGALCIVLIITTVIVVTAWGLPRIKNTTPRTPIGRSAHLLNPEEDDEIKKYWRKRREMARENEQWFRNMALMEARMKAAVDPGSISKDRRDKLPLVM